MNKCHFVGNLTADIELKTVNTSDNGTTSRGLLKLAMNSAKDKTTFVDITVFGKLAENSAKYLKKGMPAVVEARVENNNYENAEGKKVYTYQFIAESVEFVSAGQHKKIEENN